MSRPRLLAAAALVLLPLGCLPPSPGEEGDGLEGEGPTDLEELPQGLLVATKVVGGKTVRVLIPDNEKRNITWCVSTDFAHYGAAVRDRIGRAFNTAAEDWARSTDIRFVRRDLVSCARGNTASRVNIVIDPSVGDGGAAAAFPDGDRTMVVGCKATEMGKTVCRFSQTEDYYRRLFLHEIGHLLGFHHEFFNKDATCRAKNPSGWEALTEYDPESAVNYVVSNGGPCVGTATSTYITETDRRGVQKVYGIPWENLGGLIFENPALSTWGPGRLDIFAQGADRQLHHIWFDGRWFNWEPLGGNLSSGPAAVSRGRDRIDVVAREGGSNQLIIRSYNRGWGPWQPLGGGLANGAPAITTWGGERLDVFVRGTDNGLHHRWTDGGRPFEPWENLGRPAGAALSSGIAATSWGPNRIDVFARGIDGNLHTHWYDGRWQSWAPLGRPAEGLTGFDPAVVSTAPGKLDVFVVGATRGALYRLSYSAGWSNFEEIGTGLSSGVGAASWGGGRIDLGARRLGANLEHAWFENDRWR